MSSQFQISKARAVELFGNQRTLAQALGITEGAVSKWPDGPIPSKQALRIRYELKPEAFK